jgi:AcrR family transcriptional regulator
MPKPTFLRLPAERRELVVREAIVEFSERSFQDASLSDIARRTGIAKGSFYQYFEDKLDLYRWLLTEEAAQKKRAFLGELNVEGDFWAAFETFVERGMAFLVEHPRLARIAASAADPSASPEVRGLHKSICDAGLVELRTLLQGGIRAGAIGKEIDLDAATRFVSSVIGPGLTDVILCELDAELHEVLASESLREQLGPKRRKRLAREAVAFIRDGISKRKKK